MKTMARCTLVSSLALITSGNSPAAKADTPSTAQASARTMLQLSQGYQRYGDYLGDASARPRQAELRSDLDVRYGQLGAVLKPRLRAVDTATSLAELPEPKSFSFTEAYADAALGDSIRIALGKRYLGWGVGLLYSPSNRLFPDNGSATPRQEIDGKSLFMVASAVGDLQTSILVADPHVQDAPGTATAGAFALGRIERPAGGDSELTWGLVLGGGAGYRPYLGGYMQTPLDQAWTVGAEWAASRGYASQSGGGTGLRADRAEWAAEVSLALRYGLSSGGEAAIEYVYNGFHQSAAEQRDPRIALFPPAATTQSRYALRSPLAERDYLNLQLTLNELFANRRWKLFARQLFGLSGKGSLSFAELEYDPGDATALFLGLTRTDGNAESTLRRTVDHAIYLTLEQHF